MRANNKILIAAFAATVVAGCVKTTTYHTPHPKDGSLQIESYYALRSIESTDADSLFVVMDTVFVHTDTNIVTYPGVMSPGTHEVTVYNLPEGMEIKDSIISIIRDKENYLIPEPGYLFTANSLVEILPDDTLYCKMPLVQRVKRIDFQFNVTGGSTDRIEAVTGTLKGILGSFNPFQGRACGGPDSSKIGFTLQRDTLRASCLIAGLSSDTTTVFKVNVRFVDGHQQTFETILDKYLEDFATNVDKKVLTGKFEAQTNSDYGFTINGWKPTDDYEADVK